MAKLALSLGSAQGLRHEREADGAVRRRVEGNGNVTAKHRARTHRASVGRTLNRITF